MIQTPSIIPLNERDRKQIALLGAEFGVLEKQWQWLQEGKHFLKLQRPCAPGDGIITLDDEEMNYFSSLYENEILNNDTTVTKFVPASGAASRMFTNWVEILEEGVGKNSAEVSAFWQNLADYPFYPLLGELLGKQGLRAKERNCDILPLLKAILSPEGLGFIGIPKALLPFHRYGGTIATPMEEHLVETAHYCKDKNGNCHLHLTVSSEHKNRVESFLKEIKKDYERILNARFIVDFSLQSASTDTLSLDENGTVARTTNGELLFRPGGHGALLANIQQLSADVIFIKNIDNVVHSSLLSTTINYKRALAGCLLSLLAKRNHHLRVLRGTASLSIIDDAFAFCTHRLNLFFNESFVALSSREKISYLINVLDRPLRVCGVVRNLGEPGGAPFWVLDNEDVPHTQIVEGFQVDQSNDGQKDIWNSSAYFNPVDIVCSIKTETGQNYDLSRFVDTNAVCVSRKREGKRVLTTLELPGLWNGSMAFWNSVFVEVPLLTFNPVKTVHDLLRPGHQEPILPQRG
ncbi:MAG: DUF4301 family protein [Deltaproteobacteria bacterium]|nr:DUF4301 family protein [Deltaproteobacteria bacterium]